MKKRSMFGQIWTVLRLLGHVLWGAALVLLLYPRRSPAQQEAIRRRWCQQALRYLGVQTRLHGAVALPALREQQAQQGAQGVLVVANHISWLDVLLMAAYLPSRFVAKAEVAHWPLLGWLAARNGTFFLPRHSPNQVQSLNEQLAAALRTGQCITVFPEGSTSLGAGVLPFYPALFQAAIDAACPVQPMALRYTDAHGQPSVAAAYIGEASLWQSLCSIMASPGLVAHLQPCSPLPHRADAQRRRLAHQARAVIVAQLQADASTPSSEPQAGAAASPHAVVSTDPSPANVGLPAMAWAEGSP